MLEKPKLPLILGSTTIVRISVELMQFEPIGTSTVQIMTSTETRNLVIEELKNTDTFDKVKYILEKRENFWMIKLKTIHPDGLNDGLNHTNETIDFRFYLLCFYPALASLLFFFI